jgi:hypothetical protein
LSPSPDICFASSNFQEQGSLNATTKQIKFQKLLVSFLVGVFNACRLCAICIFWVGWCCGCKSILLQQESPQGKVQFPHNRMCFCVCICGHHLCGSIYIFLALMCVCVCVV